MRVSPPGPGLCGPRLMPAPWGFPRTTLITDAHHPTAMAGKSASRDPVARALEREFARLRKDVVSMDRRLRAQENRLRGVAKAADEGRRRDDVVSAALQLPPRPRRGERGIVADLLESIARLEDYLLKTSERIENILSALKQHRELLVAMNKRVLTTGTRDRIRLELDVMKNTLSILALHGVELDPVLVKDIEKLRGELKAAEDMPAIEKAKAQLDRKFDDELKKFDLEAIWARKREIPGYS